MKTKTIKHENVLSYKKAQASEGLEQLQIICRGCTINKSRENLWHGFVSSISGIINREIDNSYMTLEEEPENPYDPNAVMVVCRGEFFGTMGYVGRDFTVKVKEILEQCRQYRLDMIDENEAGQKDVKLLLTWSL